MENQSISRNKRFVLTGANGVVGRKILKILQSFRNCSIVTRNTIDFSPLEEQGVQICSGSVENSSFLSNVFQQRDTALVMMISPPQLTNIRAFHRRIAESYFTALKASEVRHVVHLSCLGAGRPDKTGLILGSYELERKLNWLDAAHIIHLRPAFYIETVFQHFSYDAQQNSLQSTLAPETILPLVSASDVAQIIAKNLQDPAFYGQTIHHIVGPEDLTMNQMAAAIGRAAAKHDLTYQQITTEEMAERYQARGFSAEWSTAWLSFFEHLEKEDKLFGKMVNCIKTPTTLADALALCQTELNELFCEPDEEISQD